MAARQEAEQTANLGVVNPSYIATASQQAIDLRPSVGVFDHEQNMNHEIELSPNTMSGAFHTLSRAFLDWRCDFDVTVEMTHSPQVVTRVGIAYVRPGQNWPDNEAARLRRAAKTLNPATNSSVNFTVTWDTYEQWRGIGVPLGSLRLFNVTRILLEDDIDVPSIIVTIRAKNVQFFHMA